MAAKGQTSSKGLKLSVYVGKSQGNNFINFKNFHINYLESFPHNRHYLPCSTAENFHIIFQFFPHPIRWPVMSNIFYKFQWLFQVNFFFLQKCLNFSKKKSKRKKGKKIPLVPLVSLCMLWYFVLIFLRNKVQTCQKNTGECFTT